MEKGRQNMSRIWSMGLFNGTLSVKASINLYEALVRSSVEYGSEIWGDEGWEEGERLQREMGRRILRCHGKTTNEAVLGELGWWRLRTRREYTKLKYWIKIILMKETRLVKKIYRLSRKEYEENNTQNWCSLIHKILKKFKIEYLWDENNLRVNNLNEKAIQKHWFKIISKKIHEEEEREWLEEMYKRPKLRTYRTFKNSLSIEPYLLSEKNKQGRHILTSIRVGTAKLRIETGRWKRPVEEVWERVCNICRSGEVESEKHFILNCNAYEDLRKKMMNDVNYYGIETNSLSPEELWQVLMNPPKKQMYEVNESVKNFLKKAMTRRDRL